MSSRGGTWFALALFLAGCPGTKEKQALAVLAEGCNINSDCTTPLVCAFRRCHAQCTSSRDCMGNETCVPATPQPLKVCLLPDESKCIFNSDCLENLVCGIDDHCRYQCNSERDCVSQQSCASGTCADSQDLVDGGLVAVTDSGVPGTQPCVYNSDCPGTLACRSGSCLPQCRADRDCPLGQQCSNEVCSGQAVPDSGLPAGWGDPCALNSQCPAPLICNPSHVCSYECVESRDCSQAAGYCCLNNQCFHGSSCNVVLGDGGTGDAGTTDAGQRCMNDLDCDDGDFCNGIELCENNLCARSQHKICEDFNPCTIDMCDPNARTCTYASAPGDAGDQDGDGHFAVQCNMPGADDCDDTNPNVYGGQPGHLAHPEICDFLDNNCDGHIDEGLWDEDKNERISLEGSGNYPWWTGGVSAAKVDGGWLLAASSDGFIGSADLFFVDDGLHLVQGPMQTLHSVTQWVHPSNFPSAWGKRLLRPSVQIGNGQTVVGAWVGDASGTSQCSPGNFWTLTSAVAEVAPNLSGYTPWPPLGVDSTSASCASGNSPEQYYPDFSTPRLAFDPRSNRWLAVWGVRIATAGTVEINAGYYEVDGGLSGAHSLLSVPSDTAYTMAYNGGVEAPQLIVGPQNVLVAWNGTANNTYPRYALFDDDLTTQISPTVYFSNTYAQQITGVGLTADGDYFIALGRTPTNYAQSLVVVSGSGAVRVNYAVPPEAPGSLMQPQSLGTDSTSSTQYLPLGPGFLFVTSEWPDYEVGYLATANDGGIETTLVTLSNAPRSGFTLLPMTATTAGLVWTDGDLKRTIVKCK